MNIKPLDNRIVFSPEDIKEDFRPVGRDTGKETYIQGTYNPGMTRLKNGNILLMIRIAENLHNMGYDSIRMRVYEEIRPWLNQAEITGTLGSLLLDSGINGIDWKGRAFGAVKMCSGYRLGRNDFESWVFLQVYLDFLGLEL